MAALRAEAPHVTGRGHNDACPTETHTESLVYNTLRIIITTNRLSLSLLELDVFLLI